VLPVQAQPPTANVLPIDGCCVLRMIVLKAPLMKISSSLPHQTNGLHVSFDHLLNADIVAG